jgi:hypothetical protein
MAEQACRSIGIGYGGTAAQRAAERAEETSSGVSLRGRDRHACEFLTGTLR